jgi:hypothetical protein
VGLTAHAVSHSRNAGNRYFSVTRRELLIPIAHEAKIAASPVRSQVFSPDSSRAWRAVGWFAATLLLAGVSDWIIAWIPFRLGTLEWEFGTITATLSGLPLVTMGLAGVLAAALGRGSKWQVIVAASLVLFFAALIIVALVIFLLDVPLALRTVDGVAQLGIKKAIAKNLSLGLLFSVAYIVAGVAALRHAIARR